MSRKTLRFTTDFLALTAGSICAIGTNKFVSDELKLYPALMGLSLLLAAAVGISHAISQSADVRKYLAVPLVVAVILQAACHVRLIVTGHWMSVSWQMLFCTGLIAIVCACWTVDRRRNSTTSHTVSMTNRAARLFHGCFASAALICVIYFLITPHSLSVGKSLLAYLSLTVYIVMAIVSTRCFWHLTGASRDKLTNKISACDAKLLALAGISYGAAMVGSVMSSGEPSAVIGISMILLTGIAAATLFPRIDRRWLPDTKQASEAAVPGN